MTLKRVLLGGSIKLNGLCGTEGMEKNMMWLSKLWVPFGYPKH